jgi:hypothetical protein
MHTPEGETDLVESEEEVKYWKVKKYDPHEYHIVNPAKTFFHLYSDSGQRHEMDDSVLAPANEKA